MKSFAEIAQDRKVEQSAIKQERKALLKELVDRTGYPIGRLCDRLKGMQTPEDLRYILSAMKQCRNAVNDRHAFNTVLFVPKDKPQ